MMLVARSKEGMEQHELITGGGFYDETAVESSGGSDIGLHMLQSCQEEADTRFILHAEAAHREGYERLIIPAEILTFSAIYILLRTTLPSLGERWHPTTTPTHCDPRYFFTSNYASKYLGISYGCDTVR